MKELIIYNCWECPFCHYHGGDLCADLCILRDINIDGFLPIDKRHDECPLNDGEVVVKAKVKLLIGIIAATKKRCFEMAKERGLKPIIEGVGDCVLISRKEDMISFVFSEFISDEGIMLDSDWQQYMMHCLVNNKD